MECNFILLFYYFVLCTILIVLFCSVLKFVNCSRVSISLCLCMLPSRPCPTSRSRTTETARARAVTVGTTGATT